MKTGRLFGLPTGARDECLLSGLTVLFGKPGMTVTVSASRGWKDEWDNGHRAHSTALSMFRARFPICEQLPACPSSCLRPERPALVLMVVVVVLVGWGWGEQAEDWLLARYAPFLPEDCELWKLPAPGTQRIQPGPGSRWSPGVRHQQGR